MSRNSSIFRTINRAVSLVLLLGMTLILTACFTINKKIIEETSQEESSQEEEHNLLSEPVNIRDDITLIQLDHQIYQYTVRTSISDMGVVEANGLIVEDGSGLIMIDTPWNQDQTQTLLAYIEELTGKKVSDLIATHSHDDNIGGLGALNEDEIIIHAHKDTVSSIAQKIGATINVMGHEIENLNFEDLDLEIFFPGQGHAVDNITVYIKDQKLLFAGCLVKSLETEAISEENEEQLTTWLESLDSLVNQYPEALVVIPGHGLAGDLSLIQHTIELLQAKLDYLEEQDVTLSLPVILDGNSLPEYDTKALISAYESSAAISGNGDLALIALISAHRQMINEQGVNLGNVQTWANVLAGVNNMKTGEAILNEMIQDDSMQSNLTQEQHEIIDFMNDQCLNFLLDGDFYRPVSDTLSLAERLDVGDRLQVAKYLEIYDEIADAASYQSGDSFKVLVETLLNIENYIVYNPLSAFSMDLYNQYVMLLSMITDYNVAINQSDRSQLLNLFDTGYTNSTTYLTLLLWNNDLGDAPTYEDRVAAYQMIFPQLELIKPYIVDGTIINEGFVIGMDHYLIPEDFLNHFGLPLNEESQIVSSSELKIHEFRTYNYSDFEVELAFYDARSYGAYPVTIRLFDPALKTARGAHVGMTRQQVLDLFPEMAAYAEGDLYGQLPSNGMITMTFFIENNVVIEIKLSQEFF